MGARDLGHRRSWLHVRFSRSLPLSCFIMCILVSFLQCRASHVVLRLVKKYPSYKIVNIDKLEYCSCLKNLAAIRNAPNYKFVKGDIRSEDFILYLLKTEHVDTIMHFAAQTHVGMWFFFSYPSKHIDTKFFVFASQTIPLGIH